MRLRVLTVLLSALALLATSVAPALAHDGGDADKVVMKDVRVAMSTGVGVRMKAVANLPAAGGGSAQGSDLEFARIRGRDYAFAGTLRRGLQIVDITSPTRPKRVAVYDCAISQGDVQVFQQGKRVLATYTSDTAFGGAGASSACGTQLDLSPSARGTVIVDVTNPARPKGIGFAPVARGSHNMTVHPSGRYLYNSNSDLLTSGPRPVIEIFDIANPTRPVRLADFPVPFVPASLGSESHDITFNASGTRAYSAALSQTLVLDTTNPAKPRQISQIVDPTVNLSHGADPITLTRKDGTKRTLLVVADEQVGAVVPTVCPGGGLHFYDITGDLEKTPLKLATWYIAATGQREGDCTAHVFRMHGPQGLITVAWYDQGVRVLDVSGLADALPVPLVLRGTAGGIKEIGSYVFEDSNTWSFKTNAIAKDGSFFGYGNDLGRGFDVYRFSGLGRTVPPLVPTELAPSARRSELLPVLPSGGSSTTPALLLALLVASAAAVRRLPRVLPAT